MDWSTGGDSFDAWMTAVETEVPDKFNVNGNYPNPFNPSTVISYQLPEASLVNLAVYDISGRQVAQLIDGWRNAGQHEATFDASHLSSGVYLYTLSASGHSVTGKMMLIK